MMPPILRLFAPGLALLLIGGSFDARADPEQQGEDKASLRTEWSATLIGQFKSIPSPEDDDDVGGWFDQYEFTPNKSSGFPFEFGVRDGAFDLFRGDSAVFQARLSSPSANLGLSGSQIDKPFFNQRLDALIRLDGLDVDLRYRRIRTEQLRLFPSTQGPGLVFDDRSGRDERFYRDRTGFAVEARARPVELFDAQDARGGWLRPELSLRGGYDARDGEKQLRIHRGPSNEWLGLARDRDRSVSDVGAGLLVAPGGLLTLTFDFDHQQFRAETPILTEADLGFPPPESTRTIGFVPETDRNTGTIRFSSRLGERAVVEGGFQISELKQVSEFTPDQRAAGLRHNEVRYYSANAAVDVQLVEDLSFNGVFKFDRRENDIERDTPLFDDTTQIDPFVKHWQRILATGELEVRFWGINRAGVGLEYEDVSRGLDFAPFGGRRILRDNASIDRDTRIVTLYGRSVIRPWRRLRIDGELGYRWAPDTGYATELDDNLYGELRASYVFALRRPLALSAYVRGGTGENDDFTMVSGQGPAPNGTRLPRSYERSNVVTGVTASVSPIDRLSLSVSFYYGRDDQDSSLDLSSLQRYFQDVAPIDFTKDGKSRFKNEQTSLILGAHYQLDERTDGGLSYSFTRAEAKYDGSDSTVLLDLVEDNRQIDSDTHVLDFELGHWVTDGLRVLGGYRYQNYEDHAPRSVSVASAVRPFDRSTHQHTVTVGVTLTSEFFDR